MLAMHRHPQNEGQETDQHQQGGDVDPLVPDQSRHQNATLIVQIAMIAAQAAMAIQAMAIKCGPATAR
jgi:hypothetical protein